MNAKNLARTSTKVQLLLRARSIHMKTARHTLTERKLKKLLKEILLFIHTCTPMRTAQNTNMSMKKVTTMSMLTKRPLNKNLISITK